MTGNWQFIPVPLPDRGVTQILVSRARDRVWVGTQSGVASYDGVEARAPQFESAAAQQAIHVNSLVEAGDGTVIVGTINDSLWRWAGDKIVALYGACPHGSGGCPRGEWAFARSGDGSIYVASSSFAPRQTEALAALGAAVADRVVPVAASASYLGFAGDELVATDMSGSVSVIDLGSGKPVRRLDLGLPSGTFVRNVSYGRGRLLVGTDTKCLGVDLTVKSEAVALANGNCTAVYSQRDGTAWLSTDTLYRSDRGGWARWSPGQSGAITASSLADDGLSNVWIGTPGGLWRYFDISRERRFSDGRTAVSSIAPASDGGVVVGLESGEVWQLTRTLEATRLALPAADQAPASAYFHGSLVAADPAGKTWVLTGAGLFRMDETRAVRVAGYPLPLSQAPAAPSVLAVSAVGKACVGLAWSTKATCVTDGDWREAAEVIGNVGGSSVGGLAFDNTGALLAVGVKSVTAAAGKGAQVGPFEPAPFGRKHLFGAIALTPLVKGADIVASGGWGGTVFLRHAGADLSVVGRGGSGDRAQPYIIRQFASHPQLGLLAASDAGLFRWEGTPMEGGWRSLRDVDPRLADSITGVVPSSGRSFWVATGSRVALISLPAAEPTAEIERSPSIATIDTNAIAYHLSTPGLVGLPSAKVVAVEYDPPIANAERRIAGPAARLDLSNLDDLTTYRLIATVSDGFLNTGPPFASAVSIQLPFYRNPYKLALVVLTAIATLGLLLTRRGPTGFLLRRVGGLRWSTEKSDPRFAIEVSSVGDDKVRYELSAPSAVSLIRIKVDVPSDRLEGAPRDVLPRLIQAAEGGDRLTRERFESVMAGASRILGDEALPDSLRLATSQAEGGSISLDLSKSLLWLPLELADDGDGSQVMLRYAVGRTVSADDLSGTQPLRAPRLSVVVFAPKPDAGTQLLPETEAETKAVAAAARSWGAEVTIIRPEATKAEVLDALCGAHLFHYAGHAEFDPEDAGRSYLPILGDRIHAEDVAAALAARPHNLLLAFINGCGTSRDGTWEVAEKIYGFGSAFLKNSAYFIGSQWPIDDEYAAAFAVEFYAMLFPPSYSLWWRLIRRDPLHGAPFAEALRLARQHLLQMSPAATQTWASYVFYGDPTRRLVLE